MCELNGFGVVILTVELSLIAETLIEKQLSILQRDRERTTKVVMRDEYGQCASCVFGTPLFLYNV